VTSAGTPITTHAATSIRSGVGPGPGSPYGDDVAPTFGKTESAAAAEQWLTEALAVRASALQVLSNDLTADKELTLAQRGPMALLVSDDATGISELQAELSASTAATPTAVLQGYATSMVVQYRVFSVVTPVVNLVGKIATQTSNVAALSALEPAVDAAISTDEQAGKPVAAAQALFSAFVADLTTTTSADDAQLSLLADVRPTSYVSATATIATAQTVLTESGARLVTARSDLRRIVRSLSAKGLGSSRLGLRLFGAD